MNQTDMKELTFAGEDQKNNNRPILVPMIVFTKVVQDCRGKYGSFPDNKENKNHYVIAFQDEWNRMLKIVNSFRRFAIYPYVLKSGPFVVMEKE